MDSNNWRPNQGTEAATDTSDWRAQLLPDSRQRIVNKIMDTLKKHLPVSGPDGLLELRKIAQRFEEKIFTAATNQSDYLRKISLKMLTMENKSQNPVANNMPSNQVGPSSKQPDQGLILQPQVHNPGQQHPNNMASQPQSRQQLLSQTIQNNVAPQPNLPSVSSLAQTSQNIGQNSNTQNIPGQNSVGSTIGQNSNVQSIFRRQQVVPQQQQQQQSQNPQQIHYQQQLLKHKLQLSQMQQQQQQNLLQPNQLQSSQQSGMQTSSVMQPSMMPTSLSSLPQNQQSNNLQQHSQVIRHQQQQTSLAHQQQIAMSQQPILPSQQQQQQLMGLQSNATNVQQHTQMLGPQSNVGDIHQPQRLLSQQSNLMNLQQRQQQLINQQNNLTNIHQQQLGSNVQGLQQQHLFGTESGNQGMQTSHHSSHMLQQPKVSMQQQSQQNASNMLTSHSQQSQPQASQQQLMPQIHTQTQLQQQLDLQQQPNTLQRDMQQKLQASGPLHQQQNVLDQQKQLYQTQKALPEASTASADSTAQTAQPTGVDWQEEVYQKIQTMKENYLPDMNEMYQKISMRLQQHDSIPRQPKSDQVEKLRTYKAMLERMIALLEVPKNNILPSLKEKMGLYERQIITLISSIRPRRNMSSLQPGQLLPTHMPSMAQSQSQVTSVQSHENQMNSQMPSNLQSPASTIQQNNIASMQPNSMSSLSTAQQNMLNSVQPGTNLDSGQGNSVNSLQQVPVSSLQQNSVSTPQQTNINSLLSQGGVNVIQPNPNTLQSGSAMLQHQVKHQHEQQVLQNQPFKQHYPQRQLMQRQQILQQQQQLHQPAKQQLSAQLHTHQMPQLQQMNDINDVKMRQGIGVKTGVFQQHLTSGQHSAYSHQQLKQGGPFPVSSPQLVQAASPQIPQHSSPQVDQQSHLPSLTKVATPLQSSNSPFVGPTPSPPMAPSPIPGDSEKPIPGVSSISNAANVGQHTGGAAAPAQSLAIGTPGISASPLLAEFIGSDGALGNALAGTSGKSTTEQPIERLIRAVKSMSTKALTAAVNDISSVVSMNDRIAGSAPGNGSRAAVGEDLVSMTNCRHQARNFSTQDGTNGIRRIKRYIRARPLNVVSSAGSMNDSEASEVESTATSIVKKPKIEANHALSEEIREINCRLIDTVVDISDEDVDPTAAAVAVAVAEGAEGTVVKCSFNPVALSPTLKSQYASLQSPIQPLRLLVPPNYPNCSPILLDKFPVESSKESEDFSEKAKSKFSISLRSLSQPMSLKDIARTWDKCARDVIIEYAQQSGGGTFSSKYGTWENCFTSA